MGNRAYIVFEDNQGNRSPAVYLHWNGGPESVYAFLDAHERYGSRGADDASYACARFVQIVGNYFGGSSSLGLENTPEKRSELAEVGDNGLYVVTPKGMRRCLYNRESKTSRWLSDDEVAQERKEAYEHNYHTGDKPISEDIDRVNAAMFKEDYKLTNQLRAAVVVGELGLRAILAAAD